MTVLARLAMDPRSEVLLLSVGVGALVGLALVICVRMWNRRAPELE